MTSVLHSPCYLSINYTLTGFSLPTFAFYVLIVNLEDCHSCTAGLKDISDSSSSSLFSGYSVVPGKLRRPCGASLALSSHVGLWRVTCK